MRMYCIALFVAPLLLLPEGVQARRDSSFTLPAMLSRAEWGADESLGLMREEGEQKVPPPSQRTEETAPIEPSEREVKCQTIVQRYPAEFRYRRTLRESPDGKQYLWPRQYSADVKLLVIHHTGENEHPEREEKLTGVEHVRAIYQWHTAHNGWGDIGYHYLIDREGVMYEGRAGGKGVVGAHTYCANTGTIGIALLGNFTREDPTEEQLKSLRWLLADLSEQYDLNPRGRTLFHGTPVPTIVTHRDVSLNRTTCAGDIIETLLPAIHRLVALRDFKTALLPKKREVTKEAASRTMRRSALLPKGTTHLRLPPRGAARLQLSYEAPSSLPVSGKIVAVSRSSKDLALWEQRGGERLRVRSSIHAERALAKGESTTIYLTLLAPAQAGTYTLTIGDLTYTLEVTGKRLRARE